uniref:Uncharacterized protein AlNc14C51G4023 n=1 Tax=Albugo laibachii Nc14 TaxID=890382 RepID=F0WBH6_9STRA|nr:conserved hypothetical protein [Albugo laibachii Nc14]|eukprot:CCA18502.1 conserved hypothetical protein [Albugo laibachii Nc14]
MQPPLTVSDNVNTSEKESSDPHTVDPFKDAKDVTSTPLTPKAGSAAIQEEIESRDVQPGAIEDRQSGTIQPHEQVNGECTKSVAELDTPGNHFSSIDDDMTEEGEAEAGEVIEDRVTYQKASTEVSGRIETNALDGQHKREKIEKAAISTERKESRDQPKRYGSSGDQGRNENSRKSSQQEPKKVRRYEQCTNLKAPVGLFACFSASSSTQSKPESSTSPRQGKTEVLNSLDAPEISGNVQKSPPLTGLFRGNQNGNMATPSVSTPSYRREPAASSIFNRQAESNNTAAPSIPNRAPCSRSRTPVRTPHPQDTFRRSPNERFKTGPLGPPNFDRPNGQRRSPPRRSRSHERAAGGPPFTPSRPHFRASRSREPERFRRSRSRGPPPQPADRFHDEFRMDRPVMYQQRKRSSSRSHSRGPPHQYLRDGARSPNVMRGTNGMSNDHLGHNPLHRGPESHPPVGRMSSDRSPRGNRPEVSLYPDIPQGDRRWRSPPRGTPNMSNHSNIQRSTISPDFSGSADAPTRKLFVTHQGDWNFELRRSSRSRCRCRAVAVTLPSPVQLPSFIDIIQLPHLSRYHEFLMSDRRDIKRIVYEVAPNTMADKVGYEEFVTYLIRGKNGISRAGVAMDLEQVGYKLFVLPPGQAARSLGYKGNNLIAVLRKKQQ